MVAFDVNADGECDEESGSEVDPAECLEVVGGDVVAERVEDEADCDEWPNENEFGIGVEGYLRGFTFRSSLCHVVNDTA